MERSRIIVYIVLSMEKHILWVPPSQCIRELSLYVPQETNYPHFYYHLETHRILDENESWMNNHVFPGDTVLYV